MKDILSYLIYFGLLAALVMIIWKNVEAILFYRRHKVVEKEVVAIEKNDTEVK